MGSVVELKAEQRKLYATEAIVHEISIYDAVDGKRTDKRNNDEVIWPLEILDRKSVRLLVDFGNEQKWISLAEVILDPPLEALDALNSDVLDLWNERK
jgi:hypothetical protein